MGRQYERVLLNTQGFVLGVFCLPCTSVLTLPPTPVPEETDPRSRDPTSFPPFVFWLPLRFVQRVGKWKERVVVYIFCWLLFGQGATNPVSLYQGGWLL